MEFSKLYVVDSVFITVLKITKCKNSEKKTDDYIILSVFYFVVFFLHGKEG